MRTERHDLSRAGALAAAVAIVAAACSGAPPSPAPSTTAPSPLEQVLDAIPPVPPLDADAAAEGERLYGQFCASCHKADLSGDPDWKTPNDDGTFKPPPHDDTGHTWHHPVPQLVDIVLNGSGAPGSIMPRFDGTLDASQVEAIIEFLRSRWGDEQRAFNWRVTFEASQRDEG